MFFIEFVCMILRKLQLVLLLFFLSVFVLLHRHAGLHKDSQPMFDRALTNGICLRRTLRADWINCTICRKIKEPWKDFVSEKKHRLIKNLIFALGEKVFVFF